MKAICLYFRGQVTAIRDVLCPPVPSVDSWEKEQEGEIIEPVPLRSFGRISFLQNTGKTFAESSSLDIRNSIVRTWTAPQLPEWNIFKDERVGVFTRDVVLVPWHKF